MSAYMHKTVTVGDIETHYLETGSGPDLVLLHGGEYGASAENTWRHNLEPLGNEFHVVAPDMLGYGGTDKIYSFSDPSGFRIKHLARFVKTLGIERAHFVGSSSGGGTVLRAAVMNPPALPIKKMVTICGNASLFKSDNQSRLEEYSASVESMEEIMGLLFHDRKWLSEDSVRERYETSILPGSWETLSASRLRRPGYQRTSRNEAFTQALASLKIPLLIMSCAHDRLNPKDWDRQLQALVPGSKIHSFDHSAHEPQIEEAEEFNRALRAFLSG